MGTRNRQRRRDKKRRQESGRAEARPRHDDDRNASDTPPRVDRAFLDSILLAAVEAHRTGDGPGRAHLLDMLEDGPPAPDGRAAVDAAVLGFLERTVTETWRIGWQPADLARLVRRELGAGSELIVIDGMAAEARQYAASTIDPAWAAQLDAAGASVWWSEAGYVDQRAAASRMSRREALARTVDILALLFSLPDLPRLCALPGEAVAGRTEDRSSVDGRLLERVRALLAKAESTTFAEEAEALSAKAQELMARHSIDQAMLDSASFGPRGAVIGRRIGVDDPYAAAKSLLLDYVADANRCRAVWSSGMGFSTVFGIRHDIDAVELLFTSLLRQATTAMLDHGRHVQRARGAAFRRSFLLGYASRIGARLSDAKDAATSDAADVHGDGLLPVLAAGASAVDEAINEAFPEMTAKRFSVGDFGGWAAGTAAADVASLGVRAQLEDAGSS